MPFQSPFNALRNQFRPTRLNLVDSVSRDATSGTLATAPFSLNASSYPAGTQFQFTINMNVSDGALIGQVVLYNLTDGEAVTNTTITTSATTPTSQVSVVLPVGAAAGNLKTSTKTYEVRLSVSGALVTDIVYLGSAALLIN